MRKHETAKRGAIVGAGEVAEIMSKDVRRGGKTFQRFIMFAARFPLCSRLMDWHQSTNGAESN